MPRTCTVCTHSQLEAIDLALVAGEPYRSVAKHFEASPPSVYRHQQDHLPNTLLKSKEAQDEAHALDVVQQLNDINAAALSILKEARESHQLSLALRAIDRIGRQIEFQAKLLGELQYGQTVNLLVTPEWVSLRVNILVALEPYPEAHQAVLDALNGYAG